MFTLLVSISTPAFAGACDAQLAKIATLTPETAAAAYKDLAACDKSAAEANFNRYLEKATDSDTLLALMTAAIDADTWKPAWTSLSKITSYDARDEVARRVGESCTTSPKVVSFLQGAYFGLRDLEFQQWDDAFATCTDPGLIAWMDKTVAAPPDKMFDDKYDALLGVYAKTRKGDALPALTKAAQKAAAAGPFDSILAKMGDAVVPSLGETPDPALQEKLTSSLVEVAKGIPAEKARSVANQLVNSGQDEAAAKLLPTIYPGRAQGGAYLYGGAAVEAGDCGGKKQAYIHYATVSEPGKRWTILKDIEAPMRAGKAKLGKSCTAEGDWSVVHTPEPVTAGGDVEAWVKTLEKEWAGKGYDVKTAKEKDVKLQ
jgi:hypothetical protein